MSFPKPHKIKLKNGLRVIIVPMKETPTVTVQVLVEAGSHYEDKKMNGVSHFLEHMFFKGTTKRPSAHMISHEFDSIGADNNAFTGTEYTGYWAKARTKHFERIFDIISDVYLDPLLPDAEIEKEKGVIIEEINMHDDQPTSRVNHVLNELLYGDQPAGRSITGPRENIRVMKRDDFVTYRNAHYVPSKTIVVIAGGVQMSHALKLAKAAFGNLPSKRALRKVRVTEQQKASQIALEYKKTEQSHLALAFRGYGVNDKREIVAGLLAGVLGKGMSSRLFQKLREELGVCYYVRSGHSSHTDVGVFKIRAGVDNKRLEEVVSVILTEVRKLRDELVPKKELDKAKEIFIGGVEMGLESSDAIADWYGMDELIRRKLETPEQAIKRLRTITPEDLRKVARDIFTDAKMNLAVVGPTKDTTRLKKLLKI
jgi:predicted Zn-dependent peptidase